MPLPDHDFPDYHEKRWFVLRVQGAAVPNANARAVTANLTVDPGDDLGFFQFDPDAGTFAFTPFELDRRQKFYVSEIDSSRLDDPTAAAQLMLHAGDDPAVAGAITTRETIFNRTVPIAGLNQRAPEGEWLFVLEPFIETVAGAQVVRNNRLRATCTDAATMSLHVKGWVEN